MTALLQAVEELARLTGDVAARAFRTSLVVERKEDGSPVSAADREAETVARRWIGARFPGDGISGEEFGLTGADARRRWLVDPIDGTVSFLAGVPLYSTLVAVVEGEGVLAGAIYCPSLNELAVAARGEGCWWNGDRCEVSGVDTLASALVLTTDPAFRAAPACRKAWERLSLGSRDARTWGDGFGYLMVATGRAEAMVDGVVHPWDVAAPRVVIEEAGGVFTDWAGCAQSPGTSGVATNFLLGEEVRRVLAQS